MTARSAPILIPSVAFCLLAAAPAHADILDIRAEEDGNRARILFLFDSQPGDASMAVLGAEGQGVIAGVHDSGQVLRPGEGVVEQISVVDRPLGLSVAATARRPILNAQATVFRDSVLFELELAAAPEAPAPAPAAVEAPAAIAQAETPGADGGVPQSRLMAPGTVGAERAAPAEPEVTQTAAAAPQPEPAPDPVEAEPEPVRLAEAAPPDPLPEPAPQPADPIDLQADVMDPAFDDAPVPAPGLPSDPGLPPPSAPGPASELLAARLDRAACDTAQDAVNANPWALESLYDHGACLARSGHGARAQEVFERLATFDPASTRALVALGALRQDAGDRGGAESYYRRADEAGPSDGEATLIRILREGL